LKDLYHIENETYDAKRMKVENSVHHKCIKYFLYSEKMGELSGSYKLDSNTITNIAGKYTEFLQVPQEWQTCEPQGVHGLMEVTTKTKTPPKVINKDVKEYRKIEKLEKNLGTIKANIEIVNELLEPEYVYEEEIVMDSESLQVIESRYANRYDTKGNMP
jgi:hypothetical protein